MPTRARHPPRLALLATALLALAAAAQEGPRPERLYVNPGLLLGTTRVVALGGAYVGIAEGAAAFSSNLAALAQRPPDLDRDWTVDFALSYVDVPLGNPAARDLDNDGAADDSGLSRQFITGLMLQYKEYGLGAFTRASYLSYCATPGCAPEDRIFVTLNSTALAAAIGFGDDELLVAFGLYAAFGTLRWHDEDWSYGDTAYSMDLLYRPQGRPYRLGVSLKPQVVGKLKLRAGQAPEIAGRPAFSALVLPSVLSIGGSLRLGPGAEHYNRLSPAARRQLLQDEPGRTLPLPAEVAPGTPTGRWLFSAEVDLIGAVDGAVPLGALADDGELERVGNATAFSPRVGVEYLAIPDRLRARLGAYVEPSPFVDRPARPHVTGGMEVMVIRYLEDWAVSASFDLANRYSNVGVSIGFWR